MAWMRRSLAVRVPLTAMGAAGSLFSSAGGLLLSSAVAACDQVACSDVVVDPRRSTCERPIVSVIIRERGRPPAGCVRFASWVGAVAMASLVAALGCRAALGRSALPEGAWLVDEKAAVAIFECEGRMCGRIVWLAAPRDPLDRRLDNDNPDPELRQRPLCGLTIIGDLRPAGDNRWLRGWFYNPNDGVTYRINARLEFDDVILARIYLGWPIIGKDKTLKRIPYGSSEGWC